MSKIWKVESLFSTAMRLAGSRETGPLIEVTHHVKPWDTLGFEHSIHTRKRLEYSNPAATLMLSVEDFDLDYFKWGFGAFVSERMRQVMALDSSGVRFFEVDARDSASAPKSKGYQMMVVDALENVSDRHK